MRSCRFVATICPRCGNLHIDPLGCGHRECRWTWRRYCKSTFDHAYAGLFLQRSNVHIVLHFVRELSSEQYYFDVQETSNKRQTTDWLHNCLDSEPNGVVRDKYWYFLECSASWNSCGITVYSVSPFDLSISVQKRQSSLCDKIKRNQVRNKEITWRTRLRIRRYW